MLGFCQNWIFQQKLDFSNSVQQYAQQIDSHHHQKMFKIRWNNSFGATRSACIIDLWICNPMQNFSVLEFSIFTKKKDWHKNWKGLKMAPHPNSAFAETLYCYSDHIWQIFDAFFKSQPTVPCQPTPTKDGWIAEHLFWCFVQLLPSIYYCSRWCWELFGKENIPESEKHSHSWDLREKDYWGYQKQKIVLCIPT